LYQLFGDGAFVDRIELAAFNVAPQCVTQVNQLWARELELEEGDNAVV
jgi:hypothetical protein